MKTAARFACLFAALGLLGACGFHPIYSGAHGPDGGTATTAALNDVIVENIPDRDGQILRNALIDRMYLKNRPAQPSYRLKVKINFTEEDLGILANATATRALLNMYSDYVLTDADGTEIFHGSAHSIASYDMLNQLYGTEAAKQDAHERTLHEISEQIVNRVSLYFAERASAPATASPAPHP